MLSFKTHPQDIAEIKQIINKGTFHSVLFIKADGSLRRVNGKKLNYDSDSIDSQLRGKYVREDHNIITVFDNNKPKLDKSYQPIINPETGRPVMGAPISVRLDRLLFFKAGGFVRDYTNENIDAINAAGITPEQLNAEKERLKIENSSSSIEEIVNEEITKLFKSSF